MKVLIVEDNQVMRSMIRRMVSAVADDISECDDGAKACALYGELRPDWVLMDIEMGEINGLVATRHIMQGYPEARIIIVTNYDDEQLRRSATTVGACGYLLKENLHQLGTLLAAKR